MSLEALAAALAKAIQSTVFLTPSLDEASLEQYLMRLGEEAGTGSPSLVESVAAELEDSSLDELLNILDPLVEPFVADNKIGLGFVYENNWPVIVSLSKFAAISTVAAARLGPESAARRVFEWAAGGSVQVRNCAIIRGIWLSDPMTISDGVHLQALPNPIPVSQQYVPQGVLRTFGDLQLVDRSS